MRYVMQGDVLVPQYAAQNRGLGDTIARLLYKAGVTQKPGCGCPHRQAALNRWFPTRRPVRTLPAISGGAPCDFYASSTAGAGQPCTGASPCRPVDIWALGQTTLRGSTGTTTCLKDGTYTGANFMIAPTAGINGTSTQRITVRAENDGGVTIDGQFARHPLNLDNNSWWVIQGINFKSGSENNPVCGLRNGSSNNQLLRIICYDARIDWNATVLAFIGSSPNDNNLVQDFGVFGTGRFMLNVDIGSFNVFDRGWLQWQGSINVGPKHALVNKYGGAGPQSDNTFQNMMLTWSPISMPQNYTLWHNGVEWTGDGAGRYTNYNVQNKGAPAGNEGNEGEVLNSVMAGVFSYIRLADVSFLGSDAPNAYPVSLTWHRYSDSQTYKHIYIYADPNLLSASSIDAYVLGDHNPTSGNSLLNATEVRTGPNIIGAEWTITPAIADATTVGGVPSAWTATSSGANLCYRFNGLTQTATPMWPWPMNDRIKAATLAAGAYTGPCGDGSESQTPPNNGCVGGRSTRPQYDVQATVEGILGAIPSQCNSAGGGPPPGPVSPAPQILTRILRSGLRW